MKQALIAAAVCSLLPIATSAYQVPKADASKADAEQRRPGQRLIGHYHIREGAKDGEKVPEERIKNSSVAITADTITVVDHNDKEVYAASYKLTRGKDRGLWNVDMESKVPKKGEKALGLIKRDGETLSLIYSLTGKRPEGFDKTEKGQHLFKLERKSNEPTLKEPADEKP
jgi:uncharacterized protein (TIGR03067 family)